AREITKRFETFARMPLAAASAWIQADADRGRGEFVLAVEGREPAQAGGGADPRAVLSILLAELPVKQAAALAAKITGARKNELYAMALEMKDL
ncbi:MAG TPA: rRNA (cytidine-2'-O-)-methyltransferase, partial [Usitatibacter sp.]|nr:rRNA (cytidine-2'-O-)-methyltransferase [Usitatibacter sp.]